MSELIRQATIHDVRDIQSLLAQLGYPDLTQKEVAQNIQSYSQEGYRLLVAEVDKKVIAFIALHWFDLMHWKGKMGRITAFCVDEHYRSKGIGKKLMVETEKLLFDLGCVKLEVTSNERRKRTHEFYLNLNYKEDSRRFVKYRKE